MNSKSSHQSHDRVSDLYFGNRHTYGVHVMEPVETWEKTKKIRAAIAALIMAAFCTLGTATLMATA